MLNLLPLAQVKDQVDGRIIDLYPTLAHGNTSEGRVLGSERRAV